MHRRTSLALLAVASSAVLVAGCGSSSSGGATGTNDSTQSPSAELTSAVSALGDASTLTSTLKLGATASDIQGLAASSGDSLTADQANAIAGAQIAVVVSAPSGKKISDLSGDTSGAGVDFTLSDNGTNWVTLRVVDKTLYVQANLKDLLDSIGKGATYAQLQASSAQLPTFLQALVAGKWISLPSSAASSLTGAAPSSSPNTQQQRAVVDALKSLLTQDVTANRTSTGSTDEFALTANSKTLAQDFITKLRAAVPSASSALSQADPSQVPSRDIHLNAKVTSGALSEVSIDLGQFDPQHKGHLPVVLDFTEGGSAISAPSGAVAVNTQELGQLFGSFSGSLGSG
jgi:hypothetical protein